jgi:hypothetical protein
LWQHVCISNSLLQTALNTMIRIIVTNHLLHAKGYKDEAKYIISDSFCCNKKCHLLILNRFFSIIINISYSLLRGQETVNF